MLGAQYRPGVQKAQSTRVLLTGERVSFFQQFLREVRCRQTSKNHGRVSSPHLFVQRGAALSCSVGSCASACHHDCARNVKLERPGVGAQGGVATQQTSRLKFRASWGPDNRYVRQTWGRDLSLGMSSSPRVGPCT